MSKIIFNCDYCGRESSKGKYAYEHSKNHYCSKECHDKATIKKVKFNCDYCGKESEMIPYRYNRCKHHFCSNECKNKYQVGNNHPKFDPDITDEERINKRQYDEYYEFIQEVLKRDDYTCQLSGQRGYDLVVHHLNGYNWYKEGRIDLDNAIVLTKKLHDLFHKIYGKGNNTIEQFDEFEMLYHYYNDEEYD